jgi:hypothetical protein
VTTPARARRVGEQAAFLRRSASDSADLINIDYLSFGELAGFARLLI